MLVLAYQGLNLVVFLVVSFLASEWMRQPFPGAFIEQTMIVNIVTPREPEAWGLLRQVPAFGYQLREINATPVTSADEIAAVLADFSPGETIPFTLHSPEGILETHAITLQIFPQGDRVAFLYIPLFIGFIFLVMGLWIFGLRRSESAGRAFALFASSVSIGSGTLFDLFTTHTFPYLWTLTLSLAGGALIELAMIYPQESRLARRWPWLRLIPYATALGLGAYAIPRVFDFSNPLAYSSAWGYIYIFAGLAVVFFVGRSVYLSFFSRSPIVRSQAWAILLGVLISFGPLASWFLARVPLDIEYSPFLVLPLVVFPVIIGYTILRFRLVRTDFMLSQGLLYALLAILAVVGYALLVSGLSLIFRQAVGISNPLLVGVVVFLIALALMPLRSRLQRLIDTTFFRGEKAFQQRVEEYTRELTGTVDLNSVLRTTRDHINTSLLPIRLHIYLYDPLSDQYIASPGEDGRPTSDLRFASTSLLVQTLNRDRLPLFIDLETLPSALQPEKTRLALLDVSLYVPLPGGERLTGWLALGSRRSGEMFSSQDLHFIELISSQASVAIERAQVIHNMERRVREMNILARVAQGVNVTVAFDDILELIYAQTDQIMPVDDYHITLYNRVNDYYFYAFCIEQDDRLLQRENIPLPVEDGLSPEVIRTRRPIITDDYARECQSSGRTPSAQGVYAWAGVPLNAGAETIGALSVSSRDANIVYTRGQVELLQSIADQTAGAIVKARLLQESERRARQLTSLNEITRQLTGTLETEPLLQKILDSAVAILNCEAGSLFLVDEQTDELVFRVTVGPPASASLVGQRLPPGTGIVGEAVHTRRGVISNNVKETATWSASTDKKTGFVTRTLLAVPMQVKERVIGVLEVINRRDGQPFVDDDQNLLSAFSGQAAVAFENARLYTLTDQELSTRVEELSVMQRIDRELNASLDVTRAMRITLDWAMRQSEADAGLIGILEREGLVLTAQQGYDELQEKYKDMPLPIEQQALQAAVESGQPQRTVFDDGRSGLLLDARSQTAVPIRREANVIGLIVMESRTQTQQPAGALDFLSRLCDHASIAISNAQLYAEVQQANIAKSEFVSFVAHELKNPMTSIKGYTELLAAGSVGQVSDMQANFLTTIRSNVERMSTLVSDLNDNSKIEAGRLRLEYKATEVAEVVDDVSRSTTRQIENKKQTIAIELPKNLPKVWADPTRLGQIITNLVSNAYKYTPEDGKIVIGAEKANNQWDPAGAAKVVRIWVRDTGIGISLDDQKMIFEKFFRSDDQKAREVPGTGLGLNITKSLVEMMGGRIWFDSEFRQGTTFHFTVPIAED